MAAKLSLKPMVFPSFLPFPILIKKDCLLILNRLGEESNDGGVVSGLSFVGVYCEDSLFTDGITVHQTWFQVRKLLTFFKLLSQIFILFLII